MPDEFNRLTLTRDQAAIIEAPEVRIDGVAKTTGRARYARDFIMPSMLWAKFLMSPHPHARIVSIDTSAALAVPGVHAVLTADDVGRKRLGRQVADWPLLAIDRVRYVGERIAVVAAETADAAEEAVRRIEVVYEELPAVFDMEEAVLPDAPVLHPDWESYHPTGKAPILKYPNAPSFMVSSKGDPDIESIFASAHLVVEDSYYGPRQHQGYLEPRGFTLWIDDQGTVQVISTNKTPYSLRDQLATIAELPADKVVVDARHIGGDFGGKGTSIEEYTCYFLAKATGRPIRAISTYTEELTSANPQHEAKYYLRTALNKEGKMIAHEVRAYQNGGAYVAMRPNPTATAGSGLTCLGPYSIPNVRFEGYNVYTNLVPTGAMRAPGDFHRGHAGEAHVDHMAREMGMDPLEFRLLNCLHDGDTMLNGGKVRNPRAVAVLEKLRDETKWGQTAKLPNRGRGVALRFRHVGTAKSELLMRLMPNGDVEVVTGHADQGGGVYTVVQRAAAAVLSVPLERINVRYGNTSEAGRDPGAGGSHSVSMNGHAAIDGSLILKDKLEDLAAEVMGWQAGEVRLEHDEFVTGSGERAPYSEVASRIAAGPPVQVVGMYDPAEHKSEDGADYNFVAFMMEVEVDSATGQITPTESVTVVDVGTIMNPIAHQGQLDGAFIYGIGQALTEELVHEQGRIVTSSLAEYKLPTQMDTPPARILVLPTEIAPGPFGAKSAGENTNIGIGGVIANAVYDAVGVQVTECPITAERVFAAIQAKAAS